MSRRILRYGERAILIELASLAEVIDLHSALAGGRPDGVVDIVPAARTIAVTVDPSLISMAAVSTWAAALPAPHVEPDAAAGLTIDVDYSGPDLETTAARLRLTPAEVVALHTGSVWQVAFCGFAPGFGYLVTDHDRLVVPRRADPRTAVPAGSVGLAGEFSGIYPRSSPGGWQLIGVTNAPLWDSTSAEPALLHPGATVTFRSV